MNLGLILMLLLAPRAAALAPIETTGADALVRSLYELRTIPTTRAGIDGYFAGDLAAAIKKDISGGEVGVSNDGDYRYAAQDAKIAGLKIRTRPAGGGAISTVNFLNYSHPGTVTYRLCRRVGGDWRIYQVEETGLNLRKALKLPAAPVRC